MGYLFTAAPAKRSQCSLDEGYLLTASVPDLQRGIAPLGPLCPRSQGVGLVLPPAAPGLRLKGLGYLLPPATPDLGCGVTPLVAAPDLGHGVAPLGRSCAVAVWHSSAAAPALGHGVIPLGRRPSGMGSSRLLPLTSDVG